jgi:polar amino acid transport system ATP-binding protein
MGYLLNGLMATTWQQLVMFLVGAFLIYLAYAKKLEPALLLPMGFGAILVNIPFSGAMNTTIVGIGEVTGILEWLFDIGIAQSEALPLLLFVGIGAMIDFGPLLSNPRLILFGAAAQFGIFATTNEKEEVVYANKQTLARIRLRVGLVFQNFNLFPHFSVLRNITEAQMHVLKASKEEAAEIAYQLLKKMDLSSKAHSYPYQLSGGQQQRVSIARALALKPDVLCFDEPTSALDPELTGEILTVIKELAQENMTMMVVTHEMAFARDISKSVIFMDDGVIIEKGTPESIFNNSTNKRTAKFLSRFSN